MNNLAWTKIIAGLIVIHCWIVTYQVTKFFDHRPQVQKIANTTSVEVVTKELPKKNYSDFLNIYTLKTFIRRQDKFPVRHDLCIVTKGNVLPNFTICTYEPAEDTFVSNYIVSEGYWENEVAFWLGAIIHRMNPSVLYLELGANLGIHGIHAAMLNCTVWAVEPQEKNIHHMMVSSILSAVNDRMTFVHNAVGGRREQVVIKINESNNGASSVVRNVNDSSMELVQTVLLQDIFSEAVMTVSPKSVVIKADIEGSECQTFLASPEVFRHPLVQSIFFEWHGNNGEIAKEFGCTPSEFNAILSMLRYNNFKLYEHSLARWQDISNLGDEVFQGKLGHVLFWSKIEPGSYISSEQEQSEATDETTSLSEPK